MSEHKASRPATAKLRVETTSKQPVGLEGKDPLLPLFDRAGPQVPDAVVDGHVEPQLVQLVGAHQRLLDADGAAAPEIGFAGRLVVHQSAVLDWLVVSTVTRLTTEGWQGMIQIRGGYISAPSLILNEGKRKKEKGSRLFSSRDSYLCNCEKYVKQLRIVFESMNYEVGHVID